jgi:hypothetical protein
MTAAAVLQVVRSAGIDLHLEGDDLVLEAAAPPSAEILELLSCHKSDIVALLRGWSAEHWLGYFTERAGIAEHDGGLTRTQAESQAFESCISAWLARNPQTSNPDDGCSWCSTYKPGYAMLPYGHGSTGVIWLHDECWSAWHQHRRSQAISAIARFGIQQWR